MSNISTFECLSNDIIVCIFDYLEPHEKFQAFFKCNNRLRKLVKRYVTYSRRALVEDIDRFSTLHSWYKHLHYHDDGVPFYMVPLKGQQMRYHFDPQVSDPVGIHWYFRQGQPIPLIDKRIEEISRKYSVKLNPLFYGYGGNYHELLKTPDFLCRNYPTHYESLKPFLSHTSNETFPNMTKLNKKDLLLLLQSIQESEQKRLKHLIQDAARCVWEEIQVLEDVNILTIK